MPRRVVRRRVRTGRRSHRKGSRTYYTGKRVLPVNNRLSIARKSFKRSDIIRLVLPIETGVLFANGTNETADCSPTGCGLNLLNLIWNDPTA